MMKIEKYNFIFYMSIILIFGCQQNKDPISGIRDSGYWEVVSDLNGDFNKIYFFDNSLGWIVGDNGKIFASNNGGLKWDEQESNTDNDLRAVVFINDKIGFITGEGRTLLFTNDAGAHWDKKTVISDSGSIFSSIHIDNRDNIWFTSNYGEIFKSTDFGDNWECKYQLESWGSSYLLFLNDTGFASSAWGNTLFRTIDYGETWESYSLPVQFSGDVFFINQNIGWTSENWGPSSSTHEDVSLYLTQNGGESWEKISTLPGLILYNINFVDEYIGWLCAITRIYYTSDSGNNWICQYNLENSGLGYIKDIFFVDSRNGWGLTQKGKVLKYTIN